MPKWHSRQSVVPRQSVLPQSAPHAKVPLTPKCPFMLICQSGNMSKYHPRQSGATPKCPNYPYMSKWFHAKVTTTSNCSRQTVPRQSISRQSVCQPSGASIYFSLTTQSNNLHFTYFRLNMFDIIWRLTDILA